MEDNFSEMLMKAIASTLLQQTKDVYGNIIDSPVDQAVRKWSEDHKGEIFDKVVEKLSMDKIATSVAIKVIEIMERFGGGYSSYDRTQFKDKLDTLITTKLAERIASKIDIGKTN